MKCPHCGLENVSVETAAPASQGRKGLTWWLLVGWWLRPLLWLLMKFFSLFGRRSNSHDGQNTSTPGFICQNCGYRWPPK